MTAATIMTAHLLTVSHPESETHTAEVKCCENEHSGIISLAEEHLCNI